MLGDWVPRQSWLGSADASALEVVGAYRFDDPAGEVGIETHLVRTADGQVVQVPVTYRGAPMSGAEASLITTMQHSVLGERWVYDACVDPVYVSALATAILTGGTEAELQFAAPSERREVTTRVSGSGSPSSAVPVVGAVTCANEGTTTVIATDEIGGASVPGDRSGSGRGSRLTHPRGHLAWPRRAGAARDRISDGARRGVTSEGRNISEGGTVEAVDGVGHTPGTTLKLSPSATTCREAI
jgi:hypothetical protein